MVCGYFLVLVASCLAIIKSEKVTVVGSGNFGTAVARLLGKKTENQTLSDSCIQNITMWVHEEVANNRKLTDIINEDHVNVKYLPNISLPSSVWACSDLVQACRDSDILIFVVPHQFIDPVLCSLKGKVKETAVAVSLIKGINIDTSTSEPLLLSQSIKETLGLRHVAVLMGANVAQDIANDNYAEATVACDDVKTAEHVAELFRSETFRTDISMDVTTIEYCSALKNIVAVAAGFCDGLHVGPSAKAAVIRQGLLEMGRFAEIFRPTTDKYKPETLITASAGVADLVATCYGGRNRLCSAAFAERMVSNVNKMTDSDIISWKKQMWIDIESELLQGQKLQGVDTCVDVYEVISKSQKVRNASLKHNREIFPLFSKVYSIALGKADVRSLLDSCTG